MTSEDPEYQYHLKDHLGNVRLTFTSREEIDSMRATLESTDSVSERSTFLRYELAKKVKSFLFDHTNDNEADSLGYAQRLNGSENERIGLAKSLSVMPGDIIRAEVYAKYVDPEDDNWEAALTTLMGYVQSPLTAPAKTIIDGTGYAISGATPLGISPFGHSGDPQSAVPKAYLNYIFINRNFDISSIKPLFRRIQNGKEDGSDVDHDYLSLVDTVSEAGFVYLYLSNDGEEEREVYFDDFKVEHIKSPVIESSDFYPFGLVFNEYRRENSLNNQYQYNRKETVSELSLGWLDFGARQLMPDIARWTSLDPLLERMANWTPYSYAFSNPILFIDPTGMLPTYNWGTGNYENEDGEIISWQEAYQSAVENEGGNKTRNLMVFMNNSRQLMAMLKDNRLNTNWHYYNATGDFAATDAAQYVSNYSDNVGKLANLVIRSHGALSSIGLHLSEGSTRCSDGTCFNRNDAIDMGNNVASGDDMMLGKDEGDIASFNAMKAFANAIGSGGSLIFTACWAGGNEGDLGTRLVQVFKAAGVSVNFNLYLNSRESNMVKPVDGKDYILGYPLSNTASWYKITSDGVAAPIKKVPQLNGTGTPVTFVNPN